MEISSITNSELSSIYLKYKKQLKIYKQRESFYDLNKSIEIKKFLSIIKWEMKKRGLTQKAAKDYAVSLNEKQKASTANRVNFEEYVRYP